MLFKKNHTAWNKGLTKETNAVVARVAAMKRGKPTWIKGKHQTPEHIEKRAKHFRGIKLSPSHRDKLSKAHLGQVSWCKGLTKETSDSVRRNSEARIGGHHSEISKLKMSIAKKGKPSPRRGAIISPASRALMSIAKKGKSPPNKGKPMPVGQYNKLNPIWKSDAFREKSRIKRLHQVFPVKDTKPEVKLQELCSSLGLEFVKHYPVLGQPDIYIPSKNLLLFEDGTYHHADPRKYKPEHIIWKKKGTTAQMIWDKDKRVTETLTQQGFRVLRFWERDINHNLAGVSDVLSKVISEGGGV